MVTTATETAGTAKPVRGRPLLPGYDPRREGSGRKPGPQRPTKAQREADTVMAKAAELAAATVERARADIEHMDERSLAQWLAKPALQHLRDVMLDETKPDQLRMQAAAKLLDAGWHKAPASTLNLHATPAILDQRQQALLLQGLNEMLGPVAARSLPPAIEPEGACPLLP